jgi:hypothetical protein
MIWNLTILTNRIDVWWVVEDGQLLLLVAYLLKQSEGTYIWIERSHVLVWQGCGIRLLALCHSTDSMETLRQELNVYLQIMRIKVDEIVIVPVEMVTINEDPSEVTHTKPKSGAMRDKLMSQRMHNELMKPTKGSAGESSNRRGNWRTQPSMEWLSSMEDKLTQGQEILVNKNVIHQLRNVLRENSSSAALVILNLPQPQDEDWDDAHEQTSRYMEMVEWVTSGIERCLLVYSGSDI